MPSVTQLTASRVETAPVEVGPRPAIHPGGGEGRLDEIVDLYAEDGEVHPPSPAYEPVIRGREALTEHYRRSVGLRLPKITVTHLYSAGQTCIVELFSQTADEDGRAG